LTFWFLEHERRTAIALSYYVLYRFSSDLLRFSHVVMSMSVQMAFTDQQIARLANISERRLRYWEETDVFRATYILKRDQGPFRKIYSFRDLVSLRTLAHLRLAYDIPLDQLRRTTAYLGDHKDSPWSDLMLGVYGKRLAFRDPATGDWRSSERLDQTMIKVFLEDISRESEWDARVAMKRGADHYGKLSRNRNVMSNAWVISGTRIPVEAIVSLRQGGMSSFEIIEQYPSLVPEDIEAAIQHDKTYSLVA